MNTAPGDATTDPSIAVLPFLNLSEDNDYFADGLSEELMNLLAKNSGLKVAGRTSSFVFKGRNEDLRQIGETLGVNHVLEGSVRRSGDTLRITAQLINVASGFHLWSETYDRKMADIFSIQDDVASAIAHALKVQLIAGVSAPTVDPNAYALYVEALPYMAQNDTSELLDIVLDLLDRAIALDPGFAKAYEAKALAQWMVAGELIDSRTAARLVNDVATRALTLDPTLVLARYYADVTGVDGISWVTEYEAMNRAMEAAPENFDVVRAWCHDLINLGYLRQAIACSNKMIELEPLSPVSHFRMGMSLSASGKTVEALNSFSRANELSVEGSFGRDVVFRHLMSGEADEALETARNDPHHAMGWNTADIRRVVDWQAQGDLAAIRSFVVATRAGAPDPLEGIAPLFWYLTTGLIDDFWDAIEELGAKGNYSWTDAEWLITYGVSFPETGFRRHPAFLEYARQTRLTDVWAQYGAPEFCDEAGDSWTCR